MAIRDFFDYQADAADVTTTAAPTLGATWSGERWARLLAHTDVVHVHVGEHLVRRGDSHHALHIVEEGRLEVRSRTARRGLTVAIGPGSVIGEVAFFDGEPSAADVVAVADAQVRRLSTDAVQRLSMHHPELGRALLFELGRILASRLRQAEQLARP